jgi:hypothetical protein
MSQPQIEQEFKVFQDWVREFTGKLEGAPVDGDYYDLPGKTVYTTYRLPLAGKGRLEVNLVNPEVQSSFHWSAEITVDDLEAEIYKHILLQTDNTIVETYGKQVHEVSGEAAKQLMEMIHIAEASAV